MRQSRRLLSFIRTAREGRLSAVPEISEFRAHAFQAAVAKASELGGLCEGYTPSRGSPRSRSKWRARDRAAQGFLGDRRVAPSHKGAAFTSILDLIRLAHVVANRLPCGVRDPRNEDHMGLAPNHHLPLAAVHAHAIARHNPGSDADLALAAYCPPGGSASAGAFFIRAIV